jgi:ATP-dependent RNA helicase RhlE
MTFDELNLNKPLLNALSDLNYQTPTTIQNKVFAVVMSGQDVCGIAQTGTGKTLAYLLPCLRQYQFSKDKHPQLLVVVPTRELVTQVLATVKQLSKYMNLISVGVFGGVNVKTQVAELADGVDILVGTPGRLMDLLGSGAIKTKAIKKIVIDEMDEMLGLGFKAQLDMILDLLPEKRQNLLFSATITPEVEDLMAQYFKNPVRVEATPVGTPLSNIQQLRYDVPNFYTKLNLLTLLLRSDPSMTRVLVFVATKELANELFEQLSHNFGEILGIIHSNKSQNHRFATVEKFQAGEIQVLIATDVIARGIDIAEVTHVFNFDLPEEPESYVHRIGRTGRIDKKGISISFVSQREEPLLAAIEHLMSYAITCLELPETLEISEILTMDEMPKTPFTKAPKRADVGPAFHEKSLKNQKVNVRRDIKAEKMIKYGRPIKKAGPKPKRKDR